MPGQLCPLVVQCLIEAALDCRGEPLATYSSVKDKAVTVTEICTHDTVFTAAQGCCDTWSCLMALLAI